jgi:hypothetical protein
MAHAAVALAAPPLLRDGCGARTVSRPAHAAAGNAAPRWRAAPLAAAGSSRGCGAPRAALRNNDAHVQGCQQSRRLRVVAPARLAQRPRRAPMPACVAAAGASSSEAGVTGA